MKLGRGGEDCIRETDTHISSTTEGVGAICRREQEGGPGVLSEKRGCDVLHRK